MHLGLLHVRAGKFDLVFQDSSSLVWDPYVLASKTQMWKQPPAFSPHLSYHSAASSFTPENLSISR